MAEIGKIIECNPRETWPNEAANFTPWLFDHLSEIGDAVGLLLEGEDTEVSIGPFFADIIARNLDDDSTVLIENQLDRGDHKHLGQILTYLAGTDAHTIIWIATQFSDEHLSAIAWLNEHTLDPFGFFAVKLSAIRIGKSPIAPLFSVMEKPNNWDRSLRKNAGGSRNRGQYKERRKEFWSEYLNRYPEDAKMGVKITGSASNWITVDNDIPLIVSMFVALEGIGLFIRGLRGSSDQETHEILDPLREQLNQLLGMNTRSDQNPSFFRSQSFDMQHSSEREAAIDWLHKNARELKEAILAVNPQNT